MANTNTVKTATKTLPCTCKSEYQDKKYGFGLRIMNPTKAGYRRTVCRKEHN